jgi:hypothetical protein
MKVVQAGVPVSVCALLAFAHFHHLIFSCVIAPMIRMRKITIHPSWRFT